MNVPLLDLKQQYAALEEPILKAIRDLCAQQAFILGPTVEQFEREVAAYCGVPHAVGMSSGTDALLIALMALEVGPGDAVITTPYSFFATAGSIARLGATPVFADIDPATLNIDPHAVQRILEGWSFSRYAALTPRVLMPVHLFGQMADMTALQKIASRAGLRIIEDAAQAIGSEYPVNRVGHKAGAIGDMGCFSFFPSKNLGGFGDGGMVVAKDDRLADTLRCLRNHGAAKKYYHTLIGGNFRLDAIQAAVLRVKLPHLDSWHEARRRNAARYDAAFAGTPIVPPTAIYRNSGVNHFHIYNQYVVRVPNRDSVLEGLRQAGIGAEVYYPKALHLQECFAHLGYHEGDMPHSEAAARETLAIPIYPELTEGQQDTAIKTLLSLVTTAAR